MTMTEQQNNKQNVKAIDSMINKHEYDVLTDWQMLQ